MFVISGGRTNDGAGKREETPPVLRCITWLSQFTVRKIGTIFSMAWSLED
jgi:hypothetical protein